MQIIVQYENGKKLNVFDHKTVKGAMTQAALATCNYKRLRMLFARALLHGTHVKSSSDSGKACLMMTEEPLEQVRKERAKKTH